MDAVQEGTRAGVEAVVDAGFGVCQVFVEIVEIFGGLAFLAEVSVAVFVSPEVLVAVFVIEHAIGAVDSQKHLEMQDFCPVELLPEGKTSEPVGKYINVFLFILSSFTSTWFDTTGKSGGGLKLCLTPLIPFRC